MKNFIKFPYYGYLIAAFLFAAMSSCSHDGRVDPSFQFEDFTQVDVSSKVEEILDDPDILGDVSQIKVVNDSIIAIRQSVADRHVMLYNISTGQYQTAVKKGMGPEEMLNVTSLSTDQDGVLWISGTMDRKIMTAMWNDSEAAAVSELRIRSPYDLLRGVAGGNGAVIGMPTTFGAGSLRAVRINKDGAVSDSISLFPDVQLPDSIAPCNFMFQADLAYSPKRQKLAFANLSWNIIEILSFADTSHISLKATVDDRIRIKQMSNGAGVAYNPSPFWSMYSNASACDDSFVVGYIGVKVENEDDFDRHISRLLEFDWYGKPLNLYRLGSEAITFDVDFKNRIIYTVENNPDPVLIRYKL